MLPDLPSFEADDAFLHALGRAGGPCDCGGEPDAPGSLGAVAAGWPIFGQFVAHDITADRSALRGLGLAAAAHVVRRAALGCALSPFDSDPHHGDQIMTRIHTYVSAEPMVRPNAFIVEGDRELVIVDTTLTMSDSKALKLLAAGLGKPIAGILLTHGHPDHVAGTTTLAPNGEVPIFALRSVNDVMKASEQEKHKQWSGLFKDEWIPRWVYPNTIVSPGESVTVAGLTFSVVDLGAGGDSDANSVWLLDTDNAAAFVGDFAFSDNHTYMMDGSILRWIANLERFDDLLGKYRTVYVGHGAPGDSSLIARQRAYFSTACSAMLDATGGSAVLTDESRKAYESKMLAAYPGYGFTLTVGLSADALAKELAGVKNYDW